MTVAHELEPRARATRSAPLPARASRSTRTTPQQGVAEIDAELHGGSRVGPLRWSWCAGKSPGEIALHWPERRILFVGDAVIGNPPGRCLLLREKVMDDPGACAKASRRWPRARFRRAPDGRRRADPAPGRTTARGVGRRPFPPAELIVEARP
ncbi:MAG: hypothetical protein U1E86_28635 [Burkholderiaceae bacterium]